MTDVRNPFHPKAVRLCDIRPYRTIFLKYTGDLLDINGYKAIVVGNPVTDDRGISKFPAVFLREGGRLCCYTVDAATAGIVPYADGGWNHVWYVTAN